MVKIQRIRLNFKEASVNSKRESEIDIVDIYVRKEQIGAIIINPIKHLINETWQHAEIVEYCKKHNISQTCRIASRNVDVDYIIVDDTIKDLIESL